MIRKNISILIVFSLLLLFFYYASYINNPFGDLSNPRFINYSSDVLGRNGMVSSASKYASQVGIDILKKGGNAVDAAVAMGFALAVTFPQAGNIGGGGFMIIRTKDTITSIDFREKAPALAYRDMYLDENGNFNSDKSQYGYLSVGVPGSVAGLLYALEKYGTLPKEEVLTPAITLADKGFEIELNFSESLNYNFELFSKFESTKKTFTKGGISYFPGEVFVQKDLARTLKRIKEQGRDGFYKGITADLIESEMKQNGGIITKQDLENYEPVERKVLHTNYKGYEIYSMAPPSSGGVALITLLNMIENDPVLDRSNSVQYAAYVHLLTECMKRVYADRSEYLGDPDFYDVPVQDLTGKNYAKERRKQITENASLSKDITPGLSGYYKEGNQTTHYSVMDKWGNMVSVTSTLNNTYGSYVVVDGAGFFLNDEMDDFASKPGVPNMFGLIGSEANSIQPNKRMLSSMTPTIILKDNEPFMILGSPGGGRIITTVFQTILNVIDFKMPLDKAIDRPRFHHQWQPEYLEYERGAFNDTVKAILISKGHELKEIGDFGRVDAILINWGKHIYYGHSDIRGYGMAIGY